MVPKVRGGQPVRHVWQWLMLPDQVDRNVWTRDKIWAEASAIEKRNDAREGRFLDINWPRELPVNDMDSFVECLFRRFADRKLPVQIDHEVEATADGGVSDHIHCLIGTRALSNEGFSTHKYRKLDNWFRRDVRRLVSDLFNDIAESKGIEVRFDPRSNVKQGAALPPEDRLPRALLRNPATPSAKAAISRRDEQRRLRIEHDRVVAEITALDQRIDELQDGIRDQISSLSQLSSWQQDGKPARPVDREIVVTAMMGAAINAEVLVVEDIGIVYVVDECTIVDAGDRILYDHIQTGASASALHLLSRKHGWRDLSAQSSDGMPIPVPSVVKTAPSSNFSARTSRAWFDTIGKGTIQLAVTNSCRNYATPLPIVVRRYSNAWFATGLPISSRW